MSTSILYMSMSLDGFIAGPDDTVEQGLGTGGGPALHDWIAYKSGEGPESFRPDGPSGEVFDEMLASGAVLTGHNTFVRGGKWDGDHHNGVQIFVPTRGEAPANEHELVSYVTDGVESAMDQAKAAAGDKTVMVHGADLAQSLIKAGVLDELEIHLIPMLLGEGRPLFARLGAEPRNLELQRVIDAPGVTHLRYRVL